MIPSDLPTPGPGAMQRPSAAPSTKMATRPKSSAPARPMATLTTTHPASPASATPGSPSNSWIFGYDPLDRVTSGVSSAIGYGSNSYTFNQRGRMNQATVIGAATNYLYNALG